jgi:hypothetical protein
MTKPQSTGKLTVDLALGFGISLELARLHRYAKHCGQGAWNLELRAAIRIISPSVLYPVILSEAQRSRRTCRIVF